MSNQVLSRPGAVMWDCFAGTGSLLVASTAHGSHCIGTDIDVRVLKGIKKGKKAESVRSNFSQYGLRFPELVRADLSALPLRFRGLYAGFLCGYEQNRWNSVRSAVWNPRGSEENMQVDEALEWDVAAWGSIRRRKFAKDTFPGRKCTIRMM